MSFSAAIEESFASGDERGVTLVTVELRFAGLAEPLRFVMGLDRSGDADATVDLPIVEGGPRLPHFVGAFGFTPPGADENGPTDASMTVTNVSDRLYGPLKTAGGYGQSILVSIRLYVVTPDTLATITGPDHDEWSGLELRNVTLTATNAQGTLSWPDGRTMNVPTGPNAIFDRASYPALFS